MKPDATRLLRALTPPLLVGLVAAAGVALASGSPAPVEPDFYTTPRVVAGSHVIDVLRGDSLRKIVAAAQPGDVIELRDGACYGAPGGLSFDRSGRPDAWIVLRGAPGARARPVIDLAGGELHVGASFVLLEGVDVVNGTGNNIHVVPSSMGKTLSNVILRNVRSAEMGKGTGAALKIAGLWKDGKGSPTELVYVEGCELTGSRDNALVDAVGVRRSVVRGCWIHDPVRISMKSPGIFFKGGSSDVLIERNLVSGIRGNAAVMIGGDTGAKWFDALHARPKLEGVNQVVRSNLVADFDDAAFEVRGARGVQIVSNTVVTSSRFAIFRLTWGGGGSGEKIGNQEIEVANNLIVGTGGARFALNDGNDDATVRFGPQLWAGRFARADGPGIPTLPQASDKVVDSAELGAVLANPRDEKLAGLADALERFKLAKGSPAVGAARPCAGGGPDALGRARPSSAPSLGALEPVEGRTPVEGRRRN